MWLLSTLRFLPTKEQPLTRGKNFRRTALVLKYSVARGDLHGSSHSRV